MLVTVVEPVSYIRIRLELGVGVVVKTNMLHRNELRVGGQGYNHDFKGLKRLFLLFRKN